VIAYFMGDAPVTHRMAASSTTKQYEGDTMSDLNAEFPSTFELWEFVLSFEDGSMPLAAWNERTLAVIAIWYLFLLPPGEAIERLELGLRRNQLRFSRRPGLLGDGIDSIAEVWPLVLRHVLTSFGAGDPLSAANRLMGPRVSELKRDRAA
jgi:hypothetical protein